MKGTRLSFAPVRSILDEGSWRQLVREGSCGFSRFLDKVRLRRTRSFLRNFLTSPRVASSPLLTASSLARAAVVALILLAGQTEESSEVKNLLTLFRYVHLKARFFPFRVGSWLDLETSRIEPESMRFAFSRTTSPPILAPTSSPSSCSPTGPAPPSSSSRILIPKSTDMPRPSCSHSCPGPTAAALTASNRLPDSRGKTLNLAHREASW
jgi:hypothetical protein